jgi:SAM-dependent methyltransferase
VAPPAAGVAGGFAKYRERRAYHWREASLHPIHGWPYTRSRMAWVARQCAVSRSILEIGCGDGALLARLAREGTTVVGVDLEEMAIELAARMFTERGLRGEFFTDLKAVEGRRFDTVVLAEVLEHLDNAEAMLARVVGLLSAQGRLVLTTPIRLLERSLDVHHVHEFWPDELRALVGRYFESVETVRMHPAWLIDLMCLGIGRIRPVAVLANLVRLCTGIELLDRLGSPLSIYWTQGIVAANARRERRA